MTLAYSVKRKVIVYMSEYVNKTIDEFEYDIPGEAKTPAAEHLFKVNRNCARLKEKMNSDFHTLWQKDYLLVNKADQISIQPSHS